MNDSLYRHFFTLGVLLLLLAGQALAVDAGPNPPECAVSRRDPASGNRWFPEEGEQYRENYGELCDPVRNRCTRSVYRVYGHRIRFFRPDLCPYQDNTYWRDTGEIRCDGPCTPPRRLREDDEDSRGGSGVVMVTAFPMMRTPLGCGQDEDDEEEGRRTVRAYWIGEDSGPIPASTSGGRQSWTRCPIPRWIRTP